MMQPLVISTETSRTVFEPTGTGVDVRREVQRGDGTWNLVEALSIPWERVGDVCAFLARLYDRQVAGDLPRRSP